MTGDERKLDKAQKDQRDIGAAENDPHTEGPAENLREETAEMVDKNEKSKDPMSPENISEHEPIATTISPPAIFKSSIQLDFLNSTNLNIKIKTRT
jgi:hypothetical protein